jgi:hypothetical protein
MPLRGIHQRGKEMARKNNPRKSPDSHKTARTTIGLKASTKSLLDSRRAPGQCYDGFLCQLVKTWDGIHDPAANE